MRPVYLDYNATTPIDPRVSRAMLPFLHEHFGNPSSGHAYGLEARRAVDNARMHVAKLLGSHPEEIVFTGGGSESNNYAIKGLAEANRARGNHIITSAVEHPAVTEVCRFLASRGFAVTVLPVDDHGLVAPRSVEKALTPKTILISIMHANNEVGTVQPIREIAEIARSHGIPVHTDAAQSVGKIPVQVDDLGVDLLTVAGHKLYAPKGVGALYVRSGVLLEKLIHGAGHEMNRRAGTENVLEIVGLGEACAMIDEDLPRHAAHMREMRDRLELGIRARVSDIRVHGHPEKRLPNTLSVGFRGLEAGRFLSRLESVAASAGAACHGHDVHVSHVLEAMGVPLEFAMGTVRFSVGRFTTREEIDGAVTDVANAAEELRRG